MSHKLTLEQVVDSFQKAHGTKKYDYSEVEYIDTNTNVKIYCNTCKEFFWQRPSAHKRGQGCAVCSNRRISENQTLTTERVIKQFQKAHGKDKYDYTNTVYRNDKIPVKIFCNTCKGYFYQNSTGHKNGHGCPICAENSRRKKRTLTQEEVINRFNDIHGVDRYDYSEVIYKRNDIKVKIKCNDCGNIFYQSPNKHSAGQGCYKCSKKSMGLKRKLTKERAIKNLRATHGNKYTYDFVNYKGSDKKILIFCREHGLFSQTYSDHKQGCGCPKCTIGCTFSASDYGKRFNSARVYVIKIVSENESFYKIGVSVQKLSQRYKKLPKEYAFKTIKIYKLTGYGARKAEIEILKSHKNKQYAPKIFFEGYSECFSEIDLSLIKDVCDKYKNITIEKEIPWKGHTDFLKVV